MRTNPKHLGNDDARKLAALALDAFDLESLIIYRCVTGSQAYGLETEESDTDRRGIYLAPAELQWSLFGSPEQFEDNGAQACYWELRKFLVMALRANPNILECLYSPLVEKATPLVEELLNIRQGFLSQMIFQTFNGYALSQFDCPVTFVSPPDMSPTEEFKAELKQYSVNFRQAEHVEQAIAEADVILVEPVVQPDYTKSRDERAGKDVGMTPANYKITRELLETKAKSDAILLHSLPRMDEVPPDVDITRWSRYWQEAFNGVVMRMALLALVLGAME